MTQNRRSFLKSAGGLTALSLGLNAFAPPVFRRRLLAGPAGGPKRLLFIFQRGGMDGINAVIPRGDSEYNTENRPTLYVPEGQVENTPYGSLDLGNNFAQLHPRMYRCIDVFRAGHMAVIHRVGYRGQSRSHFDSQQYYENGTTDRDLEVGIFNRLIQESSELQANTFPGVALSSNLMVALRGPEPVPNFSSAPDFKLRGTSSEVDKFLGRKAEPGVSGRGLLGMYTGAHDFAGKPYRDQLYRTGVVLADAMRIVREEGIDPDTYVPHPDALYPTGSFGDKLRQAAQLFKQTPVQILGINVGGWDTHTNQDRAHNSLLYNMGRAFQAMSTDLADLWDDTLVISMTEFGRTSRENGSFGTDHAEATVMFVAGGKVNGGVYNCDSTTWSDGDIFSTSNGRYLAHRTDFRSILTEIFEDHFGDDASVIDRVIPNRATLAAADPQGFQRLNFLQTGV